MRATLIVTIVAALLALSICFISVAYLNNAIGALDKLRLKVIEQVRMGDMEGALLTTKALKAQWEKLLSTLEMIASHDDIHEIESNILDMQVCLERESVDEFFRASAQVGMMFDHIKRSESLSFSNLY